MHEPARESQTFAWLAIVGAGLCFGSYTVPMKWPSVVQAQVHPLVYQSYKTFWVFVTTHVVLFFEPFELSLWGLVSGISWVPAGAAAVIAVRHVGIARGQAAWQVMVVVTSCVWGFVVLQDEAVRSWWLALVGLAALGAGIVGMTLAFEAPWAEYAPAPADSDGTDSEACDPSLWAATPRCATHAPPSFALGIGAAVFNGVWGGSMLVPQHFAPMHGVRFALSFAWGAMAVNAVLFLGNALLATLGLVPPAKLHMRVMALPGLLSGILWSAGNLCSLYAVEVMGQGLPCALIQASVVVSGLWGILYFGELQGRPVIVWSRWVIVCLSGVLVLAAEKK